MTKTTVTTKQSAWAPPRQPQVGDMYRHNRSGDVYLLARPAPDRYTLIELKTGERWAEKLVDKASDVFGCTPRAGFSFISSVHVSIQEIEN
jgi:hypothetical protein